MRIALLPDGGLRSSDERGGPGDSAQRPYDRTGCLTSATARGPPGIRTPNLRIKSLVEECWSEDWMSSELAVCVSTHPIVSRRFPFHHGDGTGTTPHSALSFRSHFVPIGDNNRDYSQSAIAPPLVHRPPPHRARHIAVIR